MWSNGTYFANNAGFSDNFSYLIEDESVEKKVMLCCKVALGLCYESPLDEDLKRHH
jgi:hypothetical protein